jgi:hypothetical protein
MGLVVYFETTKNIRVKEGVAKKRMTECFPHNLHCRQKLSISCRRSIKAPENFACIRRRNKTS